MPNKQKQIELLEEAIKDVSLSKREYIRVQAVLLRKRGYPRTEILKILGKSICSLERWIAAFNKYGISGLRSKERQLPPRYMLTRKQKEAIKRFITDKKPGEVKGIKLEGEFWDIPKLKRLIKKKYHAEYRSDESYRRLLHDCGLSYQKVEFQDKRKDKEKVEEFKKRAIIKLKKGAMSMSW